SIHGAGSKPFTSQANLTIYRVVSKAVIGAAADLAATRLSQLERTPLPNGVTAPKPVITTLRRPYAPTSARHPSSAVTKEQPAMTTKELLEQPVLRRWPSSRFRCNLRR